MTIQHVVLLKFADALTPAQQSELEAHVASWPDAIPTTRTIRLGRPLDDARTAGYEYLLYMEFDSIGDLRVYQQHPQHKLFSAWGAPLGSQPLAFDYEINDQTVIN